MIGFAAIMPTKNKLSIHDLRKLYICIEIKDRRSGSKVPTQRCDALEKSQDFTLKKYDSIIETIQKSNCQAVKLAPVAHLVVHRVVMWEVVSSRLHKKKNQKKVEGGYRFA